MKPEVVARRAQVTLDWADGRYTFRLPAEALEELQELTGYGPAWINARLVSGQWFRKEVSEPIRLGLIHGEQMKPAEARRLVKHYVDERPLSENVPVAVAIMGAVLVGVPDESIKKAGGETSEERILSPTESSASPTSGESAAPWVSTSVN